MRLVDIDDIRVMKFLSEEDDPSESDGEREYRNGWNDALTAINDIQPSAEPTEASCWGCNCPKMERMLPSAEPKESLDRIVARHEEIGYDKGFRDGYAQAITDAELVRKGKWIKAERRGCVTYVDAYAECSCCHGEPTFLGWKMNYCPNCGARMSEGGQNED